MPSFLKGTIVRIYSTLAGVYILLLLALFSTAAFADYRCDNLANKAEVKKCYRNLVTQKQEALEEFHESIMDSEKIPPEVKAQVDKDYRSFMKNIYDFCPDIECVNGAMMEQLKDMYKETNKYTIPQ